MKAIAESIGKVGSRVSVGSHELVFDQPRTVAVEVLSEKERVPVSRIGRFVITVHAPAGLDERQLTGVERAIKSCPAYGTLLYPPTVEISIEGRGGTGEGSGCAGGQVAQVG